MVAENNAREVVENDFRENLKGLLKNFFDKECREKYAIPSMVRINELSKKKGSVDEMVANLAMLGMTYVTLLMNEVVDLATQDMEGKGGEK
jgi:hypothetical protein